MIVRIQGEVTLQSCPYSQSKGSNSEGNYQLVEFVACSPSQVQNPTFLSTIHHRSSLPFPSGHPGSSSRWKIGPWPGVYEEEWSAVFSSAVCRLFPIDRKTWWSFPLLFSDLKSTEEGRNAACCKYKPGSCLAEDCRMPQFLHLHHQGRDHSPCHHQLQRSSEWTRQRTDILLQFILFIFNVVLF